MQLLDLVHDRRSRLAELLVPTLEPRLGALPGEPFDRRPVSRA